MRVLFSVEGGTGGQTRRAMVALAYDLLHVFTPEPEADEVGALRELAEGAGAGFTAEAVPGDDLLQAFEAITEAMEAYPARDHERRCQVNAGKDANLLSAAGLLACLHEGVEAHFLHERGHTVVPVLTPAPLREMLGEPERAALLAHPEAGVPLKEVSRHDTAALNKLKERGLIERADGDLVLTVVGEAYRAHLERRG